MLLNTLYVVVNFIVCEYVCFLIDNKSILKQSITWYYIVITLIFLGYIYSVIESTSSQRLCFILSFLVSICYHFKKLLYNRFLGKQKQNYIDSYGASLAYFYYYNYLNNFVPKFLERIKQFESKQEIDVPKKLIILIPKSCKPKRVITDEPEIERARELDPFMLDIGGVKNRIYNITVYQIFKNPMHDTEVDDCVWCPIEYAQPLHDLFELHNKGQISESQMYEERDIFIQTLKDLLNDADYSNNIVYLHDYDDLKEKLTLQKVILNANLW